MPIEQFNDAKYSALGDTYTGSIDDRMRKTVVAAVGATKSERNYWLNLFPLGAGSINDIKSGYFRALGYTGSVQEMERRYWEENQVGFFFPSGTVGFWYEPLYNFMYQESTGITLVTAVEQPTGMWLDKSQGSARGATLNHTSVTLIPSGGTAVNNGDGTYTCTNSGIIRFNFPQAQLVNGTFYECTVELVSVTGSTALLDWCDTSPLISITTPGVKKFISVRATYDGTFRFVDVSSNAGATVVVRASGVSIAAVPGNHILQAAAADRPVLTSRVNLLIATEDLSNGTYAKGLTTIVTNATTAPDGSLTLDRVVETAASGDHYVQQAANPSVAANIPVVGSVTVKGGERVHIEIRIQTNSGACRTRLNTTTGQLSGTGTSFGTVFSNISAAVEPENNGCFRVTLRGTSSEANAQLMVMLMNDAGTSTNYLGDITKGIYAGRYDLRFVGDASRNIPKYQRVNTASDYDTVGFPLMERADGTTDFLISTGGGGGTTGILFCAAITMRGGAGLVRDLFGDRSGNSGYVVRINASNQLEFIAGNGTTLNGVATIATLPVGETHVVTVWDDGVTFNAQIDNGAIASAARPVVAAGSAIFALFRSNTGASGFCNVDCFAAVYVKNSAKTAAERTALKRTIAAKAGLIL